MKDKREVKQWITLKGGRHIPIFEGQTKKDALKDAFSGKRETPQEKAKKQSEWEKKEDHRLSHMSTDDRIEDLRGELEYLRTKKNKTKTDLEMEKQYRDEYNYLKGLSEDARTKEKQIARAKKESESLSASTQQQHRDAIKDLSDEKYEDGTYNIHTKSIKTFDKGYQFTFCQIGDNYSDDDYQKKIDECIALSSDKEVYAGKFGGTPEISLHCDSLEQAIKYASANNQVSIWDWENQLAIKTGGTGIQPKEFGLTKAQYDATLKLIHSNPEFENEFNDILDSDNYVPKIKQYVKRMSKEIRR